MPQGKCFKNGQIFELQNYGKKPPEKGASSAQGGSQLFDAHWRISSIIYKVLRVDDGGYVFFIAG